MDSRTHWASGAYNMLALSFSTAGTVAAARTHQLEWGEAVIPQAAGQGALEGALVVPHPVRILRARLVQGAARGAQLSQGSRLQREGRASRREYNVSFARWPRQIERGHAVGEQPRRPPAETGQ
jgi:hypothetical protein